LTADEVDIRKQPLRHEILFLERGTMPGSERCYNISNHVETTQMKRLIAASMGVLMAAGTAMAATDLMSNVPDGSVTVTDWYRQPVYDSNNNKLGDVKDMLVDHNGKINAVILGVGGILGAGEKDVAIPFEAVKKTTKNNETYLTLDVTKDHLTSGPSLKYDKNRTKWVPDTSGNNASQ